MSNRIIEWASVHFVEFQNFGFNAITFSFTMTTFFAIWGAWGLVKQIKKVRSEGAETVSVMWTLTFLAMFTSCLPFGIQNGKFALVVTFFLRIPFYLILIPVIYKARCGFNRREWMWIAGLSIISFGMFFNINIVFLILAWTGAVMAADQPWKIWVNKNTVGVSIHLVIAYLASVSFWLLYGFVTRDLYIVAWGGTYFVVYFITVVMYYRFNSQRA